MVVQVGVMELPVTEDPDDIQTYMNGEHLSGGLWTALTRASNHDHSGGLSGVQLGATSIPDGSITSAKLDPSVLGPYALVDGSKPFTGQVSMNADAIVRDALYFGQQGSAGAADATLSRTGPGALRVDTHLGVGVNPAAWHANRRALQVGDSGALMGWSGGSGTELLNNSLFGTDATYRAVVGAQAASRFEMSGGMAFGVSTAPAVAAGAAQAFTARLQVAPTGTLALTPDAGLPALAMNKPDAANYLGYLTFDRQSSRKWMLGLEAGDGFALYDGAGAKIPLQVAPTGTLTLAPDAGQAALVVSGNIANTSASLTLYGASNIDLFPVGAYVHPHTDGNLLLGHPSIRWNTVYAVAGAINTSTAEAKQGITPLDPLACYQAAKDVVWYEFKYLPPVYQEPEPPPDIAYDAADDNDTKAEKKAARDEAESKAKAAHLKMVAETAPARHQRGFVFPAGAESKDEAGGALPPVPDLFGLDDRESTTPQTDLATLGCALQEVIRRLETLEGAAA